MRVSVSLATSEDESFLEFLSCNPSYRDTMAIDALRHEEYPHLDEGGQVCLDYTGVGLFSSLQRSPELYGGFGIVLSPTSANLATHAIYMEGGSTESFFRRRILQYLSLDEDNYYIVFTVNALSAFKLLAHSYPFHEAHNFLYAYDHKCESVEAVGECAQAKGALVQSVNLGSPLSRIDADDLRKKLQGKRKPTTQKVTNRGLFAYPYTSRVTGCKNSSQWIPEAQQGGWHVLLDVTSVDAKFSDSLGLALFSPDFLICSFYYVFGQDPTGFGCLVIKRSVLRILGDSSRARAIGMVKIMTKQAFSSSSDETSELYTCATNPHIQLLKESAGHRRTRSMHGFSFEEESASHRNIDITTLHTTLDKVTCFKTLPTDNETSLVTRVEDPFRMHVDAPSFAESSTRNESLRLCMAEVKLDKENGSASSSRISCSFEMGMHFEAVAMASEREGIRYIHSCGFDSVSSSTKATSSEPRPSRKEAGGECVQVCQHGSSKSPLRPTGVLRTEPIVKDTNSIKLLEGCLGTESTIQKASSSMPAGETFALDKRLASSDPQCAMHSGIADVSSRTPESSDRSRIYGVSMDIHFTCRGLDHADMLGYKGVAIRLRALSNWLVSSLSRLRHPQPDRISLVKIYSQMPIADRCSIIAFSLSDVAGKMLDPNRVQMLADRSNISLRTGIIAGTMSSDVRETDEQPQDVGCVELSNYKWRTRGETIQNVHVPVVYVSLGFLNNFSDVYRLRLFISKFLDPDFVSQELWHYQALNQETIEI